MGPRREIRSCQAPAPWQVPPLPGRVRGLGSGAAASLRAAPPGQGVPAPPAGRRDACTLSLLRLRRALIAGETLLRWRCPRRRHLSCDERFGQLRIQGRSRHGSHGVAAAPWLRAAHGLGAREPAAEAVRGGGAGTRCWRACGLRPMTQVQLTTAGSLNRLGAGAVLWGRGLPPMPPDLRTRLPAPFDTSAS